MIQDDLMGRKKRFKPTIFMCKTIPNSILRRKFGYKIMATNHLYIELEESNSRAWNTLKRLGQRVTTFMKTSKPKSHHNRTNKLFLVKKNSVKRGRAFLCPFVFKKKKLLFH